MTRVSSDKKLLIIGAGQYGMVAKEIAESMQCFDKIAFLDDNSDMAIGKVGDIEKFYPEYGSLIVAIGNPRVKADIFEVLRSTDFEMVSLVHPKSYVSPSAEIGKGCIIEPFAVIHTGAIVEDGCFISGGAVVNHNCKIGAHSHIDCNATVMKASAVPPMSNVEANTSFRG